MKKRIEGTSMILQLCRQPANLEEMVTNGNAFTPSQPTLLPLVMATWSFRGIYEHAVACVEGGIQEKC